MANTKSPPNSLLGSSRMSEHMLNVVTVSLLDEFNAAPEVCSNALAHLERDVGDFRLDCLLQVCDGGRFLAINAVLQVPPEEKIQGRQIR